MIYQIETSRGDRIDIPIDISTVGKPHHSTETTLVVNNSLTQALLSPKLTNKIITRACLQFNDHLIPILSTQLADDLARAKSIRSK